jgi:hypothetical protein
MPSGWTASRRGVFPSSPVRTVYNNALFDRDLGRTERGAAVDAMVAAYNSAGVDRYAAGPRSDEPMRTELTDRGYTVAGSSWAMGMSLDDIALAPPGDRTRAARLGRVPEVPGGRRRHRPGLLRGADASAFHTLGRGSPARRRDRNCLRPRRRLRHLQHAARRGCSIASLQATPIAEPDLRGGGSATSAGSSHTCRRRSATAPVWLGP